MTLQASPLNVLMLPDYREGNPYQQLLADAIEQNDCKVNFYGNYRRVLPIFRAIQDQAHRPDLLHLHWLEKYLRGDNLVLRSAYAAKLIVDLLLVRATGTRLVWSIHDQIEHDTKFPMIDRWTRRILIGLADRLIFHNHVALNHYQQQYAFDVTKAEVIPHGHYRGVYGGAISSAQARQLLDLSQHRRIYLNLGMLKPYKGIEQLLQVWQKHHAQLQGSTLLIAGQPFDPDYEQALAKLAANTKNVVFYPHFVESDRIHLYLSAADCVVLPYKNILTSGSAILALSFTKPIIAPRLGGIPELVDTADALLYDPNDPQGLALAIQKSVEADLSTLQQRIEQACDRLDWSSIGAKTAEVYRSCLLSNGLLQVQKS
ncbi:glycosyltransferase family 4 protein [Cyanobacteria bacterium FACHB-DQ100]|nr:glycosyltransferase family 4 protein [Cyanobacteria bacterium FACHB-DQ100]